MKERRVPEKTRNFDGTFNDPTQRVVDLRRATVHIEIERKSLTELRSILPRFVIALVLVSGAAIGVSALLHAHAVRAESIFYPTTCLGGWQGVEHAEGVPDIVDQTDVSAFTGSNSAFLSKETGGDIFCGGFTGTIPKDTVPRTLLVTLSMAAVEALPVSQAADSASDATIPTNILSSLESTTTDSNGIPTSTVPSESSPTDTPPSDSTAPPADTSPPTDVQPLPAPDTQSSFFNILVPTAYAAEASDTPANVVQTTSASQEAAAVESLPLTLPLIEVDYTMDGSTWKVLGTADQAHVSGATFSIPLPADATWDDLSRIQIRVQSLTVPDKPPLYLDGMSLAVTYADIEQTDKAATPLALFDGATFTTSQEPSVVVTPVSSAKGSNVAFYFDTGNGLSYEAETVAHGPALLSLYYAPAPGPGSYVMIQYDNDGGQFDCMSMTAEQCLGDSHFISRTNFKITEAPSAPAKTAP